MTSLLRRLTTPARVPGLRALPTQWTCRRCMATQSRTYDDALRLLGTLPTNATAKKLFGRGTPTIPHQWNIESASPTLPEPHETAIAEMLAWLHRAGIDPATIPLRAIHIAGSKGKGSTAAYASAILRAGMEGTRVGTYTSPHLVSVRERIALDGVPIPKELFAKYFFEVWDAIGCSPESDPGGGGASGDDGLLRPFFFRFMTILALHTFVREGIKDVVLECGIGGEYDATNVLPASAVSATVVTHVANDHREMLGPTTSLVAWHKAGIFREGVPAFVRPQEWSVMDVQRDRAREKGAFMTVVTDRELEKWDPNRSPRIFDNNNRALAARAALHHIRGLRSRATAQDINWMTKAMDEAVPRGRWEVFRDGPTTFYLDGAHTVSSVVGTAQWFARVSDPNKKRVLLFNQQERDAGAILRRLLAEFEPERFHEAFFSRSEVEDVRAEESLTVQRTLKKWMSEARPEMKVLWNRGVRSALGKIRGQEAEVLVTGSMHLVGAVLKVLEGEEE